MRKIGSIVQCHWAGNSSSKLTCFSLKERKREGKYLWRRLLGEELWPFDQGCSHNEAALKDTFSFTLLPFLISGGCFLWYRHKLKSEGQREEQVVHKVSLSRAQDRVEYIWRGREGLSTPGIIIISPFYCPPLLKVVLNKLLYFNNGHAIY